MDDDTKNGARAQRVLGFQVPIPRLRRTVHRQELALDAALPLTETAERRDDALELRVELLQLARHERPPTVEAHAHKHAMMWQMNHVKKVSLMTVTQRAADEVDEAIISSKVSEKFAE